MHPLRRWMVIAVALLLVSGKWTLLQGIAWSTMIIGYGSSAGLPQAIEMTFGGEHPCSMCLVIAKGDERDGADDDRIPTPEEPTRQVDKPVHGERTTGLPSVPITAALAITARPSSSALPRGHGRAPPVPPPRHA